MIEAGSGQEEKLKFTKHNTNSWEKWCEWCVAVLWCNRNGRLRHQFWHGCASLSGLLLSLCGSPSQCKQKTRLSGELRRWQLTVASRCKSCCCRLKAFIDYLSHHISVTALLYQQTQLFLLSVKNTKCLYFWNKPDLWPSKSSSRAPWQPNVHTAEISPNTLSWLVCFNNPDQLRCLDKQHNLTAKHTHTHTRIRGVRESQALCLFIQFPKEVSCHIWYACRSCATQCFFLKENIQMQSLTARLPVHHRELLQLSSASPLITAAAIY